MTKRKWNSGPPPHVGWWEASHNRVSNVWRWWNGSNWSAFATTGVSAKDAAMCAGKLLPRGQGIEWTTYYPKNARVPRINPNKK